MRKVVLVFVVLAALVTGIPQAPAAETPALRDWVADRIGDTRRLSQGARAWVDGLPAVEEPFRAQASIGFGSNVDANDPNRDLLTGQSETAIAASGRRVLAAWNDATGIGFTDSTQLRASVTGVGFSSDGAQHFSDLLGLPNRDPDQQWFGDPTIVSIDARHFIVGSLYFPSFRACSDGLPAGLNLAISVGTVNSAGTSVNFSDPIEVAKGNNLCDSGPGLALLDKPFLAYDGNSRTLAMSYTRVFLTRRASGLGQIEVVRAHVPASPARLTTQSFRRIVLWTEEPFCLNGSEANQCGAINSGAYPAVSPSGDIYVAWERNIISNFLFSGDPYVYIHAAVVPAAANRPSAGGADKPYVVTEGQRNSSPAGGVKSLDGTVISGYSRGIGQDFPRVAWYEPLHRLLVVWNDASAHPLGDIWMRSIGQHLAWTSRIERVNDPADYTLHFMPAVSVRSDGAVCTSWYDRRLGGTDSSRTDYFGECRPDPATAASDFRLTTGSTDWAGTSSLISPNFGDYTDNTSTGTTTYFTWSDGRLGVPQPFVDRRG